MAISELQHLPEFPAPPSRAPHIHAFKAKEEVIIVLPVPSLPGRSDAAAVSHWPLYQNGLSEHQYPGSTLGGQSRNRLLPSFVPIYETHHSYRADRTVQRALPLVAVLSKKCNRIKRLQSP